MKTGKMRTAAAVMVVLAMAGISNGALIAYYDFGVSTPTSANMGTAGTVADGVLMNGATIVDIDTTSRGVEWALQLNNTTGSSLADCQYMNITNGNDTWYETYIPDGHPVTIAAWVQSPTSTTGSWNTIISKGYESTFMLGTGTPFANGDDQAVFSYHGAIASWSPLKGTTSIRSDGYWNHVVATIDGADFKTAALYINGVLQDSGQSWSPCYSNDLDLLIGAEPNRTNYQFGWNGMIDDLRIYDEYLDEYGVMDLYLNTIRPIPFLLLDRVEITGPEEVAEGSQEQYTATAFMCRMVPDCFEIDVTDYASWWVVPDTFASIDGGLLTVGNIDANESISIYAEYTSGYVTRVGELEVLCVAEYNDVGEYHVDGVNGNDANDGLSRETAFATIQKGIDTAEDGDSVVVWPGVYVESVYFIDKAITVTAAADAPILEAASNNAVSFYTSEGQETVLSNFVIRDSDTGIFVSTGTPTIKNITLTGNDLGIEAENGAVPDIANCIFWNNTNGDLWNCTAQYSFGQGDFDTNLVAYWKLDGDAIDSAGTNNGTIYGATPTTGQINDALSFDGNGDYVEMGDAIKNYLGTSYTVSAWIKADAIAPNKVIAAYRQSSLINPSVLFQLDHYNADARFTVRDDSGNIAKAIYSNAITAGIWYHFAGVREGNTLNVYVNGVSGVSASQTFGPINSDNLKVGAFQFSGNPPGSFFDGTIDDVRIYDRALTAFEIEAMYEVGLAGHEYPDPLFADANAGDYHLLSERGRYWPTYDVWVLDDVSSPCIDSGDPNVEPAAERSPNGGRINMGAFGNTGYASMSEWSWAGDINRDGVVNLVDFAILAGDWLEGLPWAE